MSVRMNLLVRHLKIFPHPVQVIDVYQPYPGNVSVLGHSRTPVPLGELPQLTKEVLDRNQLAVSVQGVRKIVSIPDCLRRELLAYAQRENLTNGPLFVTRTGKSLNRTSVAAIIQSLSHDARVQPEKCNVRCLRKLYLAARKDLRENMALLMEQTYNRMLETEQLIVGWEEADGHEP